MKNKKDVERKEKAIRYIDSEIAKLQDGYLIEYLIKTKKQIQNDLNKTPQKKYRESLAVNVNKTSRNSQYTPRKSNTQNNLKENKAKKKIKDKPKKHLGRTAFYGVIAGVILGIPAQKIAYHYVENLPSSHNYITIEESRKGITDRKDHDSSKYKKYLMERFDLTEEEAEERIQKEEEEGKWER